jgi:hypothetical protein
MGAPGKHKSGRYTQKSAPFQHWPLPFQVGPALLRVPAIERDIDFSNEPVTALRIIMLFMRPKIEVAVEVGESSLGLSSREIE